MGNRRGAEQAEAHPNKPVIADIDRDRGISFEDVGDGLLCSRAILQSEESRTARARVINPPLV